MVKLEKSESRDWATKWILFIILFYVFTKSICKYITRASENRLGDRIILRCRLGNTLHRGDNWCYRELWE